MKPTNRRSFLQVTGAAMAFPYVGKVLGANEKLNIGVVGVAGRGGSNLRGVAAVKESHIGALCDVDLKNLTAAGKQYPDAKRFRDFRRMLDQKDLDAVVCSPLEINIVRQEVGKKMILVVPGIRPIKKISFKQDDQKRTLTPKQAIDLGADFLVIGRPIIKSKNPLETIKKINQSIQ